MPSNRVIFAILLTFGIAAVLPACRDRSRPQPVTIGFSQCIESDAWRKTMLQEMKRELSFHPHVKFLYRHADASSEIQIQQVRQLLRNKIDILIISPNEAEPLTPIVEEVFNKGIPVIVVDRKIASPLYTAYVGGDNFEIGRRAGEYAANLLKGQGRVVEVTGLPRSSAAAERQKGFAQALGHYPGVQITHRVNGEWFGEKAQRGVTDLIRAGTSMDLVFAHNDMMALGTSRAFATTAARKPLIIGVDGLPGNSLGMQFVASDRITATMLYPTGGDEAIRIAMRILNGEEVKKENLLQTTVIDSMNVRLMQLQAMKAASQQQEIERQQAMLSEQERIYNNQRTLLYILVSSLILAVTLGVIVFLALRENRKINRKLQLQNEEISVQKDQLIDMSSKAQAANEAKVNFFTNISHEFRTPLTLILGPLEELLSNTKNQFSIHQSLALIHKNVIRLLRLVNQLMDFRKIESEKMKLRASENDLVAFISEIMHSYKSIAQKRNIDLRLITRERSLPVWFDVTMIDKVVFNLLSNAFKFTNDNGYIHITVSKDESGLHALVGVEDNGVGMSPDAVQHAFEVFYQGEYENYKGSGLGLALSRELIHLHHGTIAVRSEKWKGTTFEIALPLGTKHLAAKELLETNARQPLLYEQEKIYTGDLLADKKLADPATLVRGSFEHTILIIEDNADLRHFLGDRLGKQYEILHADNGQSALQQAFDTIPDLIIADVVIPGKDGIALTRIFKTDIRTSHIPVILLTAKTAIEQQIEGVKTLADAYVTKPFSFELLDELINSLLVNRDKLKEHFTAGIATNLKTQTVSKIDRKFINEFNALIENSLSNENFSVEDICKAMGISRVQLYRKVKALLNVNVNDCILTARLQKAKFLLQNEALSISEIAYRVGFSSPAYFSTVFKSKFGLTPKAFKEQ